MEHDTMSGRITQSAGERLMTNEAAEDQDLEAQIGAATAALREAVLRLLRVGEVHPQLIVLAVAQLGRVCKAVAPAELGPIWGGWHALS
jgi:hypothetical protein